MRRFGVILMLLLISLSVGALADWEATREKMTSTDGYALDYTYKGPEGKFLFHYVVQGAGSKILTEVLEGSARGAGTRIYYDQAKDKENVFMETRFVTLRRSLEAGDIKDSSLYQSLFAQIVGELPGERPTQTAPYGKGQVFDFGDKAKVHARIFTDAQGNPTAYRRLEGGKEVKNFAFSNLKWGLQAIEWED